jgi:HD superfamily phosphohydrolase
LKIDHQTKTIKSVYLQKNTIFVVLVSIVEIIKRKTLNDPVYGFVNISGKLLTDILEHPKFQRLRRIKQLGLSHYVYPGALHTRFQHVIGAMSLGKIALENLSQKGIEITEEEKEAVCAALLLHDIGHGPFSHTLEHVLIKGMSHERISLYLMESLNNDFSGSLDLCIAIFKNQYHKPFLHQLVSSQLDMDRLDYLRRDSFYSGVQEGVVGQDRIINMLNVKNGELVVDEKGIYSIEKFLIARRLMYWQVYLHKTVVATENLLIKALERAFELAALGEILFAPPALLWFLKHQPNKNNFFDTEEGIKNYVKLDDDDIMSSIKVWCEHEDLVLSSLCKMLINRKLPKLEFSNEAFDEQRVNDLKARFIENTGIQNEDSSYFVFTDSVKNRAYNIEAFNIKILFKSGETVEISQASDQYNIEALSKSVTKYFLCYPKSLHLPE